jgi:hypothetical protein
MVKVNPVVMLIVASAVCWVIAAWLVVWLMHKKDFRSAWQAPREAQALKENPDQSPNRG